VRTELWQGGKAGLNKQLKYADRCGALLAVIAGSDEFSKGIVSVKDLAAGKQLAGDSASREEWLSKEKRPQVELSCEVLAEAIRGMLA
jgi:histidyl-tRNA synthetase